MQKSVSKSPVLENKEISNNIYRMTVEGSFEGKPGQFYMLRAWGREPLLSRPVSICDIDDKKITFLYEVRGKGTELLRGLKAGDEIELQGPMGNGFDISKATGKVALVSGGIGIAPMLKLAKEIKDAEVHVYAGFREDTYLLDEFKPYVSEIHVSTDKGSTGYKGVVTDLLSPFEYSSVICCGPEVMMYKVKDMCIKYATPVYMSMEKHMACGVGACLGCTCETKDGMKRTCKEGPVFNGREVI